jgi:hypothetical protein
MTPSSPSSSPSRRRTSRNFNRRIDQTRWPDAETVGDWIQCAPLAKVKALIDHWRHRYDWVPLIITHGRPGSGFSRGLIGAVKVKTKRGKP